MKYFSIAELSHSTTATARGINNTPPSGVAKALNKAVSGASISHHLCGEMAYITADSRTLNKQ